MSKGITKGRLQASLDMNCNDVTSCGASTGALAASTSNRLFSASPRDSHEESKRIKELNPHT